MTTPERMTAVDRLVDYFRIREQERADAVAAVCAGLTGRELALVREAAVMGYVHGARFGAVRDAIPPDPAIVVEVIGACLSMPELYPTLAGREREEET